MPNGKTKKSKATVQVVGKKAVKKREPSWSDAGILMKKGATPEEIQSQQMIIALAVAFDIPPQGITLLADNPYINKQGLEFMFAKHKERMRWDYFLSKPVQLAKLAGETAIFKTLLYDKKGRVVANGYGSANAANIRMGTIKVFLNEMAETRSQNRCLRKVLSPILYQTFLERVSSLNTEQAALVAKAATNFGSVTAEEIGAREEAKAESLLTEGEMKNIAGFLQEVNNAKTIALLNGIGVRVKTAEKAGKFNKNQLKVLREAYASKSKKLAFK